MSLDVVSLFTKVPTDETLAVVCNKLAADPSLEERTCIKIDILMEMLTVWRQPTSGWDLIYTDKKKDWLWVHHCHHYWLTYTWNMALGSISLKPSMCRYVDDTFILWPHQEDVQTLHDHVNSIRPSIQFTMEKEQEN